MESTTADPRSIALATVASPTKPTMSDAAKTSDSTQPKARSLLQLARALCHPLLLFDAYTFRWLTFDPHDIENNQQQAFTKVTNVGLISALILTVFASWVQEFAATSYARYHAYEDIAQGISCAALCTGVIFLVMSVINSVLLLLAVNDAEDDHHATILLRKLGMWFTLPALYFYLGVLIGTLGWFVWIPAVFPTAPAVFIVVVGFAVGVAINSGYYQFIVLSVYEAREECGMNLPGLPALLARFTSCGRKPPKIRHAGRNERDHDHDHNSDDSQAEATRILELSFQRIGRSELLGQAKEGEWDHIAALHAMEERHALALGLKPGAAVRFLSSVRRELKLTQQHHAFGSMGLAQH